MADSLSASARTPGSGGLAQAVQPRKKPWRENLEAISMAIVLALLLKAFIVEAYKIPTGSMQPTLMGMGPDPRLGGATQPSVHDRILVDKFSYKVRDPRRFEVTVFKYPLDRSKNFVKRLVGMPAERFAIRNGDLWSGPLDGTPLEILRRPDNVMSGVWKALDRKSPMASNWRTVSGGDGWSFESRDIEARGDGKARFGTTDGPVLDRYYDGYPDVLRDDLPSMHPQDRGRRVGDLRVETKITALAGCEQVWIELREDQNTYRFVLPGPAAAAGAAPEIRVETRSAAGQPATAPRSVAAEGSFRLKAGKSVRVAAENLDDRLRLFVNGKAVAELEVEAQVVQDARAYVAQTGEGADFGGLMVFRDIYYQHDSGAEFTIPEDRYLMLGDNTQDSSDSREWRTARMELLGAAGESTILEGNFRGNENPRFDGDLTWFEDVWGERFALDTRGGQERQLGRDTVLPARPLQNERAPFVPRELITGRAISVFWPISPTKGLYRLKWVR